MTSAKQTLPVPQTLGLKKSFGFGDRLGLATPGHLAALLRSDFAGIFAQQSIREMDRTERSPEEVMRAAQVALGKAGYLEAWGADADHLKTEADVRKTAGAGFTFFTIDPSAFVVNEADRLSESELEAGVARLVEDGVLPGDWSVEYLRKPYEISEEGSLRFTPEALHRAVIKYGRAVAHCEVMAGYIEKACAGKPFEIEVSVDETDSPTSPLEHLFFGLELKRRGVRVVSLAPRFIGEFEKGIDYKGDLGKLEVSVRQHVAIARFCGPYKLSVHSGSDKFTAYPIFGRECGELLHVKTAGTSYLEALRAVCRKDKRLFREIVEFCRGRFETDRKSYHISTTAEQVRDLPRTDDANTEKVFLDEIPGRQLLHVTFGSVLTQGRRASGESFKGEILALLEGDRGLYAKLLNSHFSRHLDLLKAG